MAEENVTPTGGETPPASETEKPGAKASEPVNPAGENTEENEEAISPEDLEQLKKDPTVLYKKLRQEVRTLAKEKTDAEKAADAAKQEAEVAKGDWKKVAETRLTELTKAQTTAATLETKLAAETEARTKAEKANDDLKNDTVDTLTENWPEKAKQVIGTRETKSAQERWSAYLLAKGLVDLGGTTNPKPPASPPDPQDARQGGGNTPDTKSKDEIRRSLVRSGMYG